ncbi:MAG TPA: thiamine-phosphate kinase [Gemmatimonadaceae bacterium]|nr:thiamine-phosphate kinase [Gemmatimonadaceae bacterium]
MSEQGGGTLAMGPGAEFDLIRTLLAAWGSQAVGEGGDAAALEIPPGEQLVVSTDTSVEGVHFRREWLTPREIGYRATAAALSDLAACAARPLGILLALSLSDRWVPHAVELARGVGEAARLAGAPIVGGDVTRARDLTLGVTVLGSAARPLTRAGARAGDVLYVTGELGGPAAAVRAWSALLPSAIAPADNTRVATRPPPSRCGGGAGAPPPHALGVASAAPGAPHASHRARFAHPVPRIAAGVWLAEHGARAMIDVSDGLAGDAAHLAAASGVTVVIELERVPAMQGVSPMDAVESGEEYELLLAAPDSLDVDAFRERFGIAITPVGQVVQGAPEVVLLHHGQRVAARGGYQHFGGR